MLDNRDIALADSGRFDEYEIEAGGLENINGIGKTLGDFNRRIAGGERAHINPVADREMIVEYDHPQVGKVRLPGNPIKMTGMEGTISKPAPMLGEHTDEVLSGLLGLDATAIAALRAAGAVK